MPREVRRGFGVSSMSGRSRFCMLESESDQSIVMNGKSASELGKSLILHDGARSILMLVGPPVKLSGGGLSLTACCVSCGSCVGSVDDGPLLGMDEMFSSFFCGREDCIEEVSNVNQSFANDLRRVLESSDKVWNQSIIR